MSRREEEEVEAGDVTSSEESADSNEDEDDDDDNDPEEEKDDDIEKESSTRRSFARFELELFIIWFIFLSKIWFFRYPFAIWAMNTTEISDMWNYDFPVC